jgi:hypothetical protein
MGFDLTNHRFALELPPGRYPDADRVLRVVALEETEAQHEKAFKLNISGNEAYYTACSILAMFEDSCSKLDYRKTLI